MEICLSSQVSFVGLMQLLHWKNDLQALPSAPPEQHAHDPNTLQQRVAHSDPPRAACGSGQAGRGAWGWLQAMGWGRGSSPGSWDSGHPTATASPPVLPRACCRLGGDGGNKEVSCPCKEQCQKLSLWQGLRVLLWLCKEGSHRPLSISLCLAPSWGRDYKSP